LYIHLCYSILIFYIYLTLKIKLLIVWACLFRLLAASDHQKLLRTAKRSAFQPTSIKFVGTKTIQNQHKHIIGWVIVIVIIRHFLDLEPYEQLYLPPHIIVMILRFSPQPDSLHSQIFRKAGQKKAEPNRLISLYLWHCLSFYSWTQKLHIVSNNYNKLKLYFYRKYATLVPRNKTTWTLATI
jgi:hypothetical protein